MEVIIEDQRYNPETAKAVGLHRFGRANRYCGYIDEILYRTSGGRWFLLSISRVNTADSEPPFIFNTNSEHIIPMNKNDAFQWLKQTGHRNAMVEYFPDRK